MTTVPSTPTSDGLAGLSGVPAGLPDVTLLAQLAGEFFAALPSGSHDARLPFAAPTQPPQPPQTELALANRAPALAPAPARPAAAPDEAVDAATGGDDAVALEPADAVGDGVGREPDERAELLEGGAAVVREGRREVSVDAIHGTSLDILGRFGFLPLKSRSCYV